MTETIRVRWIPYTKLPPNSKLVTRRTRWGNQNKLIQHGGKYTREKSLEKYDHDVDVELAKNPYWLDDLFGYNLACSCMLPHELKEKGFKVRYPHCHADILLNKIKDIRQRRFRIGL